MAALGTAFECPILVWMITLNHDYSLEEYDEFYKLVTECIPGVNVARAPNDTNTFRDLLLSMLPLLMMRHRRIPRSKLRDCVSQNGKHWIEQDDLPPEKFLSSMIGYRLAMEKSLLGMAMMQGYTKNVINIHSGSNEATADPDRVLNLMLITHLMEDIFQEHLKRSTIKRLFGFRSDRRLSKKCREKLQIVLEILRVQSRIEIGTRADLTNNRVTSHQETQERGFSPSYGTSRHANPDPHSDIGLSSMTHSHAAAGTCPTLGNYYAARPASTSIQDNSLFIDGSGNNITMIIGSPGRGDTYAA